MEAFREGLSKSGFVDGRNVAIELRFARAGLQQLPELAADLVRLKVDVILASGDHAPRVAQQVTETVPIVAFSDDILGAGLMSAFGGTSGPGAVQMSANDQSGHCPAAVTANIP